MGLVHARRKTWEDKGQNLPLTEEVDSVGVVEDTTSIMPKVLQPPNLEMAVCPVVSSRYLEKKSFITVVPFNVLNCSLPHTQGVFFHVVESHYSFFTVPHCQVFPSSDGQEKKNSPCHINRAIGVLFLLWQSLLHRVVRGSILSTESTWTLLMDYLWSIRL